EDIVAKFEYTAPAGYTSASYAFTYQGEPTETKTATITEGKNTIEFAEANPARIGETIIVSLTLTGEGKEPVTDTYEFSVADYLKTLLTAAPSTFKEIKTQEQYVAMRTLAANLVNYSAKTQEYIGLEDTSSALLTTETVKGFVGDEQPADTDLAVGGEPTESDKYGFIGANLLLDGRVSVCFYFVAESKENLSLEIAFAVGSTATLTNIEEATEIAVKEGVTAYKAVLEGVSAIDMDKTFTAKLLSNGTAVGKEVTYSVKSYAHAMLSSKNDSMKSLALALYNYGVSAKSYVEAMEVTGTDVRLPETKTIDVTDDKYPASFVAEKAFSWAAVEGQSYAHSLVADGNGYMYTLTYNSMAVNASGDSNPDTSGDYYNTYRIVKLDMTGKVIGYTKTFVGAQYNGGYYWGGVEYFIPLWVKGGYVYSYNGDGKTVRIATTDITAKGVDYEVVDAIQFGTIEPKNVKAVVYNATQQKYAVYTLQTLYIFDETNLTEATRQQSVGINMVRMGGNDNNLYFVESTDNVYAPNITVYDWTGVKGTGIFISNKESLKNVKIQGITEYNGVVYYQLIGWSGGVNAVYKSDCSAAKKYDLNDYGLGKYLLNCDFETTASSLTNGWTKDGGSYIYNAIEKNGWVYEYRSCLVRFNPTDKTTVKSNLVVKKFDDENVAMFTYGDKVFVYDITNKVWKSLPLLFNADATATTEESLPIELGAYASSFRNIYVFEDTGNVAVFTGSKIVLLDSTGAEKAMYAVSTSDVSRMGGGKGGYIYYTTNAQGTKNPTVVVIDTKNGRRTTLTLPNVSQNPSNSKISSIFELNGTLCYSLFKWDGTTDSSNIQCVNLSNLKYAAPHKETEELTNAN
ncbi:MAG TPA: hypothetical protein DDY77_05595, partial [Clostridiales bacterium]|nr:hypothetical protein [Clostridiales bacterium]